MNSADHSIAFADYALRRRFYFIDFYPSHNEILYNWFKDNNIEKNYATTILDMLNQINKNLQKQMNNLQQQLRNPSSSK